MVPTEEQRYWLERDFITDLLKQLPSYIFWKNKEGTYLGCNDAFAESAGFSSAEEIIGKTDYDLPWKAQSELYRADDQQVIQTKLPKLNIEEPQTRPDGKQIVLLTSKVPLLNRNGNVIGVLGVYSDITERKKIEEDLRIAKEKAEAANQAKSVFVANMSHDIRTPMAGVIGMADILDKEGDTEKDREYGHIIHDSSERLLSLLNDILEVISADEIREENIQYETFSLKERILHVQVLYSSTIKIKQINFDVIIDPNLPEYIVSDRIKIDRILLNLVGNALKFTDQGGVELNCKLLSNKDNIATIEFIISDSGLGIPEDKLDKIFDRFYRITPSYEEKYTGYGIGLFIVKRFVALLDGEIKVRSELGKGTIFSVTLPVKVGKKGRTKLSNEKSHYQEISVDKKISAVPKHISTPVKKHQNGMTVLFIEDDNIARRTGQYFLESNGFNVQAVSNGEDAIKKAKSEHFDLIISDIGLAGIDGNEITYLIRRWEKKIGRKPIPIIGLSAHASDVVKKEALEAGMNDIVDKPITEKKIKAILDILQKDEPNKQIDLIQELDDTLPKTLGLDLPVTEDELSKLDQYPFFDEKEGLKAMGNSEMLHEVLRMLINETIPTELENIEQAHKISDWELVRQLAHKLKGAALYCGTIRLKFACQYMERYLLAGHKKLQEDLYHQLIDVLKKTQDNVSLLISKSRN